MTKILFSPDPPETGAPGAPVTQPGAPELPPAAQTVVTGTKSEREITLETELQTERGSHAKTAKEKKDRELRIAELEDELHKLKSPPSPKQSKSAMEEFFED